MTISADLRDKLEQELNCLTDSVEGQLPCLAAFNLVLEYDGGDSDWYDGVEQRAADIQQMIADDRATMLAIQTLLDIVDVYPPAATFTADDAKEHAASKVDVQDTAKPSAKPVPRRKVTRTTKSKGTRPTLRAKLLDEDIATMRKLANEGVTYTELAVMFHISRGTVGNIVKGVGCYKFDRDAEAE